MNILLVLNDSRMFEHLLTLCSSYKGFLEMLSRLIVVLMKGSRLPLLKGTVLRKSRRNNVIQTATSYCGAGLILP